jgi:hypothetical protein
MSFLARLSSDRASIILETALCLPLYFVLLIFLIDMPQIMAHRQSLLGVARLHADVKARNFGYAPMITEDLCKRLFWGDATTITKVEWQDNQQPATHDKGKMSRPAKIVDAYTSFSIGEGDGLLATATKLLGQGLVNILSGGSIKNFLTKVFTTDIFYSSCPQVAIKTILPAEFYAGVMGLEPTENHPMRVKCPAPCWQPSGNCAQEAKKTVFGKIGDKISKAIGWVKKFVTLPGFDFKI